MTSKEYFEIIIGVANIFILCITAYFIHRSIYSPVDAVKVGRQLNQEQKKDDAKRSLFLLLFSLRGHPLNYDFVRGLNQIEVVFEDVPEVIKAWRAHFSSLQNKGQTNAQKNWEIERAEFLSAMAVHLGYKNIPHSELLRDYYPEGHGNQLKDEIDFRLAALNFYKTNAELGKLLIDQYDKREENTQNNV